MEKDILTNYNFLPLKNTDINTANQYFLVDNHKTFLINKVPTENTQDMQYITQVQDVKGVLGRLNQLPLYSLAQQPYYVGVGNVGTASDIVLPDQLVVPNVEQANVFADNYFLQPNPDANMTELTNVKATEQFGNCDANMQVTIENHVAGAPCTEITLTEEQYQMLEQKGWVLLDLNNRVYLLDNSGAHDITDNEKMIERYRDLENNLEKEIEEDLTYIKNLDLLATQKAAAATNVQENIEQDKIVHETPPIPNNVVVQPVPTNCTDKYACLQKGLPIKLKCLTDFPMDEEEHLLTKREGPPKKNKIDKPKPTPPRKLLKIPMKTKLISTEVPIKVFLGTTVNGKKLYAQLQSVESKNSFKNKDKASVTCRMIIDLSKTKEEIQQHEYLEYHQEAEYALVQSSTWSEKSSFAEVRAAERIAERLLAAPRSREMMQGQRLLITTCEKKRTSEDKPEYKLKSVVTGRAVEQTTYGSRTKSKSTFVHMPHLLSYIMKQKTEKMAHHGVENFIIHLHISETLHELLPPQVIVTITKRCMPLKALTSESILIINESKAKHTCNLCFEAFSSLEDFNKHRKDCLELKEDDKSSLLEQLMNNHLTAPIISLEKNGHKCYSCQYCKKKFYKIANYKKHLIIHLDKDYQTLRVTANPATEETNLDLKCTMCGSTFVQNSSLTEHILTTHISV